MDIPDDILQQHGNHPNKPTINSNKKNFELDQYALGYVTKKDLLIVQQYKNECSRNTEQTVTGPNTNTSRLTRKSSPPFNDTKLGPIQPKATVTSSISNNSTTALLQNDQDTLFNLIEELVHLLSLAIEDCSTGMSILYLLLLFLCFQSLFFF